jgi:hypothetical protein
MFLIHLSHPLDYIGSAAWFCVWNLNAYLWCNLHPTLMQSIFVTMYIWSTERLIHTSEMCYSIRLLLPVLIQIYRDTILEFGCHVMWSCPNTDTSGY